MASQPTYLAKGWQCIAEQWLLLSLFFLNIGCCPVSGLPSRHIPTKHKICGGKLIQDIVYYYYTNSYRYNLIIFQKENTATCAIILYSDLANDRSIMSILLIARSYECIDKCLVKFQRKSCLLTVLVNHYFNI